MRAPAATTDVGQLRDVRGVKSADRTLDLLEELALATSPLTLGDLSRALSIPKSSLHGLLRTLERREWVESDDSGLRFRLGVRALQLASSHLAQDRDLRIVHAAMDELWKRTGETVQLGRLAGADVVYLAQLPARHPVRLASTVGERLPAHATALGKALLAARDGAELRRILRPPLVALTDRTLTEWGPLEASLTAARERGVAWDDEEVSSGLTCMAVAVPATGLPTHAVSVSVPTFRLSDDLRREIPDLLLQMVATLRARLGAASPALGED
jgi:DNA-binding IclR family transcriptional regulator